MMRREDLAYLCVGILGGALLVVNAFIGGYEWRPAPFKAEASFTQATVAGFLLMVFAVVAYFVTEGLRGRSSQLFAGNWRTNVNPFKNPLITAGNWRIRVGGGIDDGINTPGSDGIAVFHKDAYTSLGPHDLILADLSEGWRVSELPPAVARKVRSMKLPTGYIRFGAVPAYVEMRRPDVVASIIEDANLNRARDAALRSAHGAIHALGINQRKLEHTIEGRAKSPAMRIVHLARGPSASDGMNDDTDTT